MKNLGIFAKTLPKHQRFAHLRTPLSVTIASSSCSLHFRGVFACPQPLGVPRGADARFGMGSEHRILVTKRYTGYPWSPVNLCGPPYPCQSGHLHLGGRCPNGSGQAKTPRKSRELEQLAIVTLRGVRRCAKR